MGPKRVNKLPKIVVSNVTAHNQSNMSNESENQTTTIEKIPRKSIHFDDAIYYDGVHYFVKTLKHLTEAELGYKSLAALSKEEYQFYGYTKNTYDKPWGWGFLDRFSENWILVTPLVTKKEKNMILETHHLQS
jgi:hypothetical protein